MGKNRGSVIKAAGDKWRKNIAGSFYEFSEICSGKVQENKICFLYFLSMILYTNFIEYKQNRSKQAQHHAVSFYFFLGMFDNMKNMSVLLTTENKLGQKIQ